VVVFLEHLFEALLQVGYFGVLLLVRQIFHPVYLVQEVLEEQFRSHELEILGFSKAKISFFGESPTKSGSFWEFGGFTLSD